MRGNVLASYGRKFAETHQDVSSDSWVAIVSFGNEHAEDRECIWLDKSLGSADEQGEETGAVLAIASGGG